MNPDPPFLFLFLNIRKLRIQTFYIIFQVIFSLANIIFASPFGRFLNNINNERNQGNGLRIMDKKSQDLSEGTFDLCAS